MDDDIVKIIKDTFNASYVSTDGNSYDATIIANNLG